MSIKYFFGILIGALIVISVVYYFGFRDKSLDLNKIRNLELKGNYYINYKTNGEPLDIIHMFYREYELYENHHLRDSTFRIYKLTKNYLDKYHDYTVSVFEFGKFNSVFQAFRYQLSFAEVYPYYYIINTSVRSLNSIGGITAFKHDLISKGAYEFYNMKLSEGVSTEAERTEIQYYVEIKKDRQYMRLSLPQNLNLIDSTTEGNQMLNWLFNMVEKDFGYNIESGNMKSY